MSDLNSKEVKGLFLATLIVLAVTIGAGFVVWMLP